VSTRAPRGGPPKDDTTERLESIQRSVDALSADLQDLRKQSLARHASLIELLGQVQIAANREIHLRWPWQR